MHLYRFVFALSASALVSLAGAAGSQDPDVRGIRLGMSPAEVRAAIEALDGGFEVDERKVGVPGRPGETGPIGTLVARRHNERIGVDFSRMGEAPRAIRIVRGREYPLHQPVVYTAKNAPATELPAAARPDPAPSLASAKEALVAKYGAPSEDGDHRPMRWYLDPARTPCPAVEAVGGNLQAQASQARKTPGQTCSRILEVKFEHVMGPHQINRMNTWLVDVPAYTADAIAFDEAMRRAREATRSRNAPSPDL